MEYVIALTSREMRQHKTSMAVGGMLGRIRFHFDHTHQTAFGVVEHVAVHHPHAGNAWTVVVTHDETHGLAERYVHGIFPGEWSLRLTIFVEYLKEKTMQVYGMRPFRRISHRPDLRLTDRCLE